MKEKTKQINEKELERRCKREVEQMKAIMMEKKSKTTNDGM